MPRASQTPEDVVELLVEHPQVAADLLGHARRTGNSWRGVLRRQLQRAADKGLRYMTGPELEYFMLRRWALEGLEDGHLAASVEPRDIRTPQVGRTGKLVVKAKSGGKEAREPEVFRPRNGETEAARNVWRADQW